MSCHVPKNYYVNSLQMKMNVSKHSCGLVNTCGHTMTSSAWVVARDVNFVKTNPYTGPTKELHQELKKVLF
jgi:hypothetical protein